MTKKKNRKLTVRKIEAKEEIRSCSNCKYLLKAVNPPFCLKRMLRVSENSGCPKYEKGNPTNSLSQEQRTKLLQKYLEFEINVKIMQAQLKELKKLMQELYTDGEIIGKYRIVNKEITKQLLDISKAKELIAELPNANEYFKESKQRLFRAIELKGELK